MVTDPLLSKTVWNVCGLVCILGLINPNQQILLSDDYLILHNTFGVPSIEILCSLILNANSQSVV